MEACKSCTRPLNVAEQKAAVRCSVCRNKLCGDCQTQTCGGCDSVMCAACLNSCAGDCNKKFCTACLTKCSNLKCRNSLCTSCEAFFILSCAKCDKHICKICALCSSCSGECRVITCEDCSPPACAGHCGERFCGACAEKCLNHAQCGNVTFCGACIPLCRGGCGRKLCKSCGQACKTCGGCICSECARKLTCSGKDCDKLFCSHCVPVTCKRCGGAFCTECVVSCSGCDRPVCTPCSHSCCAPGCKRRLCDSCVDSEQTSCQNKCGQFFCSPCSRSSLRNVCSGPCGGTNFCRNCLSTCQGEGCQARFCSSCIKGRYSCYNCNLLSLCSACAMRDHFSHNCFTIGRSANNEENTVQMAEEEEEDADGSVSLRRRLLRNKGIVYLYADNSCYYGDMAEHVPHGKGIWTHPKFNRDAEVFVEERAKRGRHVTFNEGTASNWENVGSEISVRNKVKHSKSKRLHTRSESSVTEVDVVGAPVSSAVLLFFEGDWVHGQRCGQGNATFLNGMRYRGHWKDGKRHGNGELLQGSLRAYEGDWEADCKHGKGIQCLSDGSVYEGGWLENKRHGEGRLVSSEGEYNGQWQSDQRHGQGTQVYSVDGTVYKGLWQKDERHGKGRLAEPFDEAWQEGTWKNGQRWGTFTFTWTDGVIILQYFRADHMVAERALPLSESNLSILALRQHVVNAESTRDRLRTELSKSTEHLQGLKKDMTQIRSLHDKTTSELSKLQAEINSLRIANSALKSEVETKNKQLEDANASIAHMTQAAEKSSEKISALEREEKGAKLRLERSGSEHKKIVDSLTSQLQAVTTKYNVRKQQLRQLLPLQGQMHRVRKKKEDTPHEAEGPQLARTRSGHMYSASSDVNSDNNVKNDANNSSSHHSHSSNSSSSSGSSSSVSSSSSISSKQSGKRHRPEEEDVEVFSEDDGKSRVAWDTNEKTKVAEGSTAARAEEFICACGLRFEFSYQLRVHQKRDGHTNPDPNAPMPLVSVAERRAVPKPRRMDQNNSFACTVPGCGKSYSLARNLWRHEKEHGMH